MAGSISNFLTTFKTDPARAFRFDVFIPSPQGIDSSILDAFNLTYRCEVAQLPGRNFSTMEQKTYGPIEKFPYWTNYNDIDLTFLIDDDMIIKKGFDQWMEYINPAPTFNFNYKNDYSVDITIRQFNAQNDYSYQVRLVDAFPINMNQLDLDWSSDSIHKLTVTFAYTYWQSIPLE